MDKLKERVKIKNIWTKNRIAVPPMVCFHWSDDSGCVTDKNLQHYRDMAAGGSRSDYRRGHGGNKAGQAS